MSGLDAYSRHKCAVLVCLCALWPRLYTKRSVRADGPDANALGDTPALANVPVLAS
jgi:hypothetical protein